MGMTKDVGPVCERCVTALATSRYQSVCSGPETVTQHLKPNENIQTKGIEQKRGDECLCNNTLTRIALDFRENS